MGTRVRSAAPRRPSTMECLLVGALWGAAATVAGCTAIVDGVVDAAPRDGTGLQGGASGAGAGAGGGAGGGAGAGAGGLAGGGAGEGGGAPPLACGEARAPSASECAAACTGGCANGTCSVACLAHQSCKEADISCPEGMHCEVSCLAKQSCEKATIRCPSERRCDVRCSGNQACKDAAVHGTNGPLETRCSDSEGSCDKLVVTCGTGACRAVCDGSSHPELRCNSACACTPCGDDDD